MLRNALPDNLRTLAYCYMETADILKKVRKIEIKTRGVSRHFFSGDYHSAFKGQGMSFSEVREYQYGDDVRSIDWNVTARTGEPYIKLYEEERELSVMLVVDMSRSTYFGSHGQLKSDLLTELCAVLAFSAISNNDKVGALFFSDRVEKYIPPKKGRKHILLIIRELINFEPSNTGTDLTVALRYLNNVAKKRNIVFVVSDFQTPDYDDALRLAARRHDLIGIHLFDKREMTIPDIGLVRVRDSETERVMWLDTSDSNTRARYATAYAAHYEKFRQAFLRARTDFISIETGEGYIQLLHELFKSRR